MALFDNKPIGRIPARKEPTLNQKMAMAKRESARRNWDAESFVRRAGREFGRMSDAMQRTFKKATNLKSAQNQLRACGLSAYQASCLIGEVDRLNAIDAAGDERLWNELRGAVWLMRAGNHTPGDLLTLAERGALWSEAKRVMPSFGAFQWVPIMDGRSPHGRKVKDLVASGGLVDAGKPYRVGEFSSERFLPLGTYVLSKTIETKPGAHGIKIDGENFRIVNTSDLIVTASDLKTLGKP